jgi:hypothetical protein
MRAAGESAGSPVDHAVPEADAPSSVLQPGPPRCVRRQGVKNIPNSTLSLGPKMGSRWSGPTEGTILTPARTVAGCRTESPLARRSWSHIHPFGPPAVEDPHDGCIRVGLLIQYFGRGCGRVQVASVPRSDGQHAPPSEIATIRTRMPPSSNPGIFGLAPDRNELAFISGRTIERAFTRLSQHLVTAETGGSRQRASAAQRASSIRAEG